MTNSTMANFHLHDEWQEVPNIDAMSSFALRARIESRDGMCPSRGFSSSTSFQDYL
jgi:hypothetical protein